MAIAIKAAIIDSFNNENLVTLLNKICALPLIVLLLGACSKEYIAEPMCRAQKTSTQTPSTPAACLIRIEQKLLAIQTKNEAWHLPVAKHKPTQSAQCNAHHAVWQSTGLNVFVAQKLGETKQKVSIYNCILDSGFDNQTQDIPIPPWASRNISAIKFINPYDTELKQWSDSSDLIFIRQLFNHVP